MQIFNSNIAFALLCTAALMVLLGVDYPAYPLLKCIGNMTIADFNRSLLGVVGVLYVLWIIFSALITFFVLRHYARRAKAVAESLPYFESRLFDLASSSRRLLVSDKGFLGTTTSAAEIGDEIGFLVGCSSAVILRASDPHGMFQDHTRP
jgi:hypothetical protein